MSVSFLVFLAIIWGIFGLWGFLRGWKAALLMLVFIIGTLLMLSLAMPQVQEMFDYVNKAATMVTGSSTPVIKTTPANMTVIMLSGAVILAFLLGLLRIFRTKPSFSGFLLGFFNGYLFSAYMLAALLPQRAILPLPIKIPGLTTVSLSAAAASPPSTVAFTLAGWVEKIFQMPCLPTAIVAGIFLFILLTVLLGNRGSRKG